MGGIRSVGVALDCDRCKPKKPVVINDAEQADFYRKHAERGEDRQDVRMFVAILNTPDGKTIGIDFEYICPKCCEAIFGYLGKIDTDLAPKKNGKGKDEKPQDPPAEKPKDPPPAAKEQKTEKKSSIKITDEREDASPPEGEQPEDPPPPPPEEQKSAQPGSDYLDEDLFA